jgi:serine O-acetyltransferase
MSSRSKARDLEAAIDAVLDSYKGPDEINNLESAMLPNKRRVIDAYQHLKPVLFMGFFSTHSLNQDNLRYSVSAHLYPAHELFTEQIGRATGYEARRGGQPHREDDWCDEVVLRLFRELPALRKALAEDCRAAFDGDPAANSVEEVVFSYPAIEAIVAHRIAHVLYREGVPMLPRIISEHAHSLTGIDIHPGAEIGPGFFIDHGTGVVIGETAVIGRRVKLYQGVTLGALSVKRCSDHQGKPRQRHPTIEDEVTIYAGATILGGDTVIGAGSVIGGNTWIIKSVPPGSKVYGNVNRD